jgi:WD40 repeat protein
MKMFKKKEIKGLVCLLAIMLASKGWAVAKEATKGTETIEPKLIMEYKFDEPVVDIIFGETEMTVKEARKLGMKGLEKRKATERVKVQYPKVLVTEKVVKFLDEKGKVINEMPLEKYYEYLNDSSGTIIGVYEEAFVSPDGEYLIKYKYGNECVEEVNLYTRDGQFVRKLTEAGFGPIFSPDGEFFITKGAGMGEMAIRFYDREGRLLKEHGDFIDGMCITGYSKFSPDGKYVVAGGDKLYLFDNRGEQLWSYGISGIDDIAISKDGNTIVVLKSYWGDKTIIIDGYLFNRNGDLLWKCTLPGSVGNVYGGLSPQGDYLVVAQLNKIYFFNIITKKLIWEKEIEGRILEASHGYFEHPIFISASGEYFTIKGFDREEKSIILLFNRRGKQIWTKKIDYIPRSAKISLDRKTISIKTEKSFYIYENPAWQAEGGAK